MALSKIFFVLALTAVAEAMACNPRKDATCCKDTDKCKNFSQLIKKNPEKCSSSKNFAKRCRASCDAKYPEKNYCAQPDEENGQPDEENGQPDEENGQPDENGNSENDEAMPCNPRKDATCCKDTDKCKNFSQLIQKNPEKCGSSKNFAKRCRASCHVQYPEKNYCVSTNAGKIVAHVALEFLACKDDGDCDDDQFCSVSCRNDAPGCETQESVCQPCDKCHGGDYAVSGKCRDGCVGCPDGGVPPCETDNQGDDVGDDQGPPQGNGEEVCENHGYGKDECNAKGCCTYNHGYGYDDDPECMSDVGTDPCDSGGG